MSNLKQLILDDIKESKSTDIFYHFLTKDIKDILETILKDNPIDSTIDITEKNKLFLQVYLLLKR